MDEQDFIENYLHPSDDRLDQRFVHPMPVDADLKKSGEFIVQCQHEETFSTNIITKYIREESGIRLIEVYKNTQHKEEGIFVRLLGTWCLVKKGYPVIFLDAAVSNISPITAQREVITTRVAVHLPQANDEDRGIIFDLLTEKANELGFVCRALKPETLPEFWGPIWLGESKKFDPDAVRELRNKVWQGYCSLTEKTEENPSFDYKPVKEHMVFNNSRAEHLLFKKMGMSVPVEAQAAFFSAMVSGL